MLRTLGSSGPVPYSVTRRLRPFAFTCGVAGHHRIGCCHLRQSGEGLGIVHGEGTHRADGADLGAVGLGLARRNADQVGAELGEFGNDELLNPGADRGEQNDRSDADRNAGCRQGSAQALRAERAGGESQAVDEGHLRPKANTGSSLAARLAGSNANRMPVMSAVATPAATAHKGG